MTPIYAILRHPGKYKRHFLPIKTSGCTIQDGVSWRQQVKFTPSFAILASTTGTLYLSKTPVVLARMAWIGVSKLKFCGQNIKGSDKSETSGTSYSVVMWTKAIRIHDCFVFLIFWTKEHKIVEILALKCIK